MLKIIAVILMSFMQFHSNVAQTKSPSCPVRPASDIRGPPRVPGRPGSKGEPGYGKLIKT